VKRNAVPAIMLLSALTVAAAPKPLVYLPCDRPTMVAVGRLGSDSVLPETLPAQTPGIRGECMRVAADLRLSSEGNFNTTEGTIAFWIRPAWKQQESCM